MSRVGEVDVGRLHLTLQQQPPGRTSRVTFDDQTEEMWGLIVGTILYLTTTCVLWWFGTRNKQEQPKIG